MSSAKKKVIVFVLGGPGSGKGTQCDLIKQKFNFVHLSAGELLREQRRTPGSQYGDIIQDRCDKGKIVPSQITISLIKKALNSTPSQRFLIDGFPRNIQNYQTWNKISSPNSEIEIQTPFVLFLECSLKTLQKRLAIRRQSSGRTDDKEQIMKQRFNTFQQQSMPVVDIYEKQGKLLRIDSEGTIEEVFAKLQSSFEKISSQTLI